MWSRCHGYGEEMCRVGVNNMRVRVPSSWLWFRGVFLCVEQKALRLAKDCSIWEGMLKENSQPSLPVEEPVKRWGLGKGHEQILASHGTGSWKAWDDLEMLIVAQEKETWKVPGREPSKSTRKKSGQAEQQNQLNHRKNENQEIVSGECPVWRNFT